MSKRRAGLLAALLTAALGALPAAAAPAVRAGFRFGVIGHAFQAAPDDAALRQALRATNGATLGFVVANGVKAAAESCGDRLYGERRALFDDSAHPLIVSLAGSDWSGCKNSLGRPNAIERLNRLREVFFGDAMSLGAHKLALTRLSSNAKFRSYAENAHWQHGRVLFATINLPADNNHFRPEAGRNSEYEDRLVANRSWLQRLFALAQHNKLDGIVLFSDGDVGVQRDEARTPAAGVRQDGFAAVRRQIRTLSKTFPGKVLLIDANAANPAEAAIAWNGNLGHVSVAAGWMEIRVMPGAAQLFAARAPE